MIEIAKYKAIDGKEFDDKEKCIDYEALIKKVDSIMGVLPKLPNKDCNFSNGGGYIQHEPSILNTVKRDLLGVIKKYVDHKWVQQSIDDPTIHSSYVGRLLNDYSISPLEKAWDRFMCIDKYQREWGQPYYANNPDDATQKRLN